MEYVSGFTLAEYLKQAKAANIKAIAERFLRLMPAVDVFDTTAAAAYAAKRTELERKLGSQAHPAVKEALVRLERHPWEFSAHSYCHGDLTLENVIYKDGELYLIDFLDSFYDSWTQDFGKLIFDLESEWSYRHGPVDANARTRASIFKEALLEELYAKPYGKELAYEVYHVALMHALRILPYTNDTATRKRLYASIGTLHALIDSL
jgi:5-methylthioribose kinase